jgi:hypothetical protein
MFSNKPEYTVLKDDELDFVKLQLKLLNQIVEEE